MISSIDEFLRYFDGVQRRTHRDVAALPVEADGWTPPAGAGEQAWSVNTVIAHIAAARSFFVGAYLAEGWTAPPFPDTSSRDRWLPVLESSAADLQTALASTPQDWLTRRVPLADAPGDIAGWRVLMMLTEHEIHHRSQLDTWAGLNGWNAPQIFGRRWEEIEGRVTSDALINPHPSSLIPHPSCPISQNRYPSLNQGAATGDCARPNDPTDARWSDAGY